MGAKVLILKVVSHNNRLKDLKLKLKVSNMSSYIFHNKTKIWLSRPKCFRNGIILIVIICSRNKLDDDTFANIIKKWLIIVIRVKFYKN